MVRHTVESYRQRLAELVGEAAAYLDEVVAARHRRGSSGARIAELRREAEELARTGRRACLGAPLLAGERRPAAEVMRAFGDVLRRADDLSRRCALYGGSAVLLDGEPIGEALRATLSALAGGRRQAIRVAAQDAMTRIEGAMATRLADPRDPMRAAACVDLYGRAVRLVRAAKAAAAAAEQADGPEPREPTPARTLTEP